MAKFTDVIKIALESGKVYRAPRDPKTGDYRKDVTETQKTISKLNEVLNPRAYRAPRDPNTGEIKPYVTKGQRSLDKLNEFLSPRTYRAPRDKDGKYKGYVTEGQKKLDKFNMVVNPYTYRAPKDPVTGEYLNTVTDRQKTIDQLNAILSPQVFRADSKRRQYTPAEKRIAALNEILNPRNLLSKKIKSALKAHNKTTAKKIKKLAKLAKAKSMASSRAKARASRAAIAATRLYIQKINKGMAPQPQTVINTNPINTFLQIVYGKINGLGSYSQPVHDKAIAAMEQTMGADARDFKIGKMTPTEFNARTQKNIKIGTIAAVIAGAGGLQNLSRNHMELISDQIGTQLALFDDFEKSFLDGEEKGDKFVSGVQNFARGARQTYSESQRQYSANETQGEGCEKRVSRQDGNVCEICQELEELGPQPIGLLPRIGEDSHCGKNCRCMFEDARCAETSTQEGQSEGEQLSLNL